MNLTDKMVIVTIRRCSDVLVPISVATTLVGLSHQMEVVDLDYSLEAYVRTGEPLIETIRVNDKHNIISSEEAKVLSRDLEASKSEPL